VPDQVLGRRLLLLSLGLIVLLNVALSLLPGDSASPAVQYGRPLIVALGSVLVWQGRSWARLLLILMSMGVLFAGPIALGNGLPLLSVAGAMAWVASVLCVVALGALYVSPSIRAVIHSAAGNPSVPAGA
jgi:hypothetical protein